MFGRMVTPLRDGEMGLGQVMNLDILLLKAYQAICVALQWEALRNWGL